MIEWMVPLAIGVAALTPRGRLNERKTIESCFQRLELFVKEDDKVYHPTFKKRVKKDGYTLYIYNVPMGLASEEIIGDAIVIEEALKKPVEIEYSFYLFIYVYNKDLPTMFHYKDVPEVKGWQIPVGKTHRDIIFHDFDKTPHMTIAGTTRFGKTVMLKNIMTYLIEHHPDEVAFYIIDLKGGLEFERYRNLQQVNDIATNQEEAANMLLEIHDNIKQRESIFRKKLWSNILDTPIKNRTFIIVDEAAQLTPDSSMSKDEKELLEGCQRVLSEVARVAGALGYRLIYCTQYPTADCMPRQVKMNADGKISFRLPAGYASKVAIDEVGAEKLPSNIKGRGLYKTHELRKFQAPFISDDEMMERLGGFIRVAPNREEKTETRSYTIDLG